MARAQRCPEHGSAYTKGCGHCQESRKIYQQELKRERRIAATTPVAPPPPPPKPDTLSLPGTYYVEGDTSWIERGRCQTERVPTYIFFPERGERDAVDQAKAICADCPVKDDCLAYALRTNQPYGIWGGKSGKERRTMRDGTRICPACREIFRPPVRSPRKFCPDCWVERRAESKRVSNRMRARDRAAWGVAS
jgi:WhiB family transcriptional regulator, redox-sensing transcriptional regulator